MFSGCVVSEFLILKRVWQIHEKQRIDALGRWFRLLSGRLRHGPVVPAAKMKQLEAPPRNFTDLT